MNREIIRRMKSDWHLAVYTVDKSQAAVIGAASGAASGAIADTAAAGLTLGFGLLVGAVVGALSGLGAATVYNARHRKEGMELTWSDKALEGFALEALLLYLAIAHFGRGRGAWRAAESPPEWKDQLQKLLSENDFGFEHLRDNPTSAQPSLVHHVDGILRKIFESLYGRGA